MSIKIRKKDKIMQYVGSFIYIRCPIKQKRTPKKECVCDIDCFVVEKLGGDVPLSGALQFVSNYLMAL